ncbi:hypothetical protein SmphiM6_30 [Sinorhizobium phage phiM6]|nr:hypothetical protein SmphiM6_30 [Sinorhizobium phage phiM6]
MEELNPWDEGYIAPTESEDQELNPWDEGYQAPVAEEVEPAVTGVAPEDVRDPVTGIPGSADHQVSDKDNRMPTSTMYKENIDLGNPEENFQRDIEQYESYDESDPNFTGYTITGAPTYKNTVVPFPEARMEGQSDMGFGQMAGSSIRGAVKNATVTGAAMLDQLYHTVTGDRSNLAELADKSIADPTIAGETTDALIMDGGEIAIGVISGYAIPTAAMSKGRSPIDVGKDRPVQKLNPTEMNATFAKALSGFGSMVGSAVTQDEDAEPLVVGTLLDGVPVDENGHYSEEVVAKKLNLLYDEMTIGLGAQKAAQWAGAAAEVVKGITIDQIKPMFSEGSREADAIQNVVDALNMNTPEGREQLRQVIRDNKDVWIKIADQNVDNFHLERTTMSAIEEGLSKTDAWRARRAMDLEAGVSHTGQTTLQERIASPMIEFDAFQKQMVDSRGGSQTIEAARGNLAKQGTDEILAARQMPIDQANVVQQSEEFLRNRLRNDPMLGDDVKRMEGNVALDTGASKARAEDVVIGDLRQTVDTMKDVKDKLYDAIPEDAGIDAESFSGVMRNAEPYLPPQITDMIADEGTILNFKTVHNEILPVISKRITQLEKSANPDMNAIEALQEVRRNITQTQLEHIATKGNNPETRKAADAARRYYAEDYVPFAKTSSTKDLFDTRNKTKYDLEQDAQNAVNSLSDKKKGGSRAVLDLLSRPESSGNPEAIFSVYLGDVAKNWGRKLADPDGIDKLDPSDILRELDDVGVTFKERFPAQVKQVETLATELKAAKGDIKKQREILRQYEKDALARENEVYGGVLGKFIDKGEKGEIVERQDGYNIFKKLLNREDSGHEIDAIVKRVRDSGDEVAQKGLESAYLTYLRDRITEGSSGFSPTQASRLVDIKEVKMLKEHGKKIFKDPDIVDSYDAVVSALLKERDKRSSAGLPLQSKGGMFKAATFATNFLINSTLGVLNPTATKVRNVAGAALRKVDGDKAGLELMERIHADPEYTLELLRKLENRSTSGFSQDGKNTMWRIGVLTGLYAGDDKKKFESDWDNYTRKEKLRTEMDSITKRQDRKDKEEFNNIR